jgi:membrane-bound serine protease (ClpP class)
MYWALALLLLSLGLGLAILEVFFPSGGILGFLSFTAIVSSIVVAFWSGAAVGMAVLAAAIVGLPVVVVAALHWLPDTPVGRMMLLKVPTSEDVLPDSPKQRGLRDLIGRTGRAKSKMLPAGAVRIDGRTIDAVSEGMAVEPGQTVRVIEVRGNRVVVRPVDEDEEPPEDDPLSRPIDSLGPDPFD